MRRALISDIHGNLEALNAVLEDIASQQINEIFCLGDLVSFGPNPRECIDRVMESCRVTSPGNHDQGVLWDLARSKIPADRADAWTWKELNDPGDRVKNEIRRKFLAHLPQSYEIGPYLFVHGSPRNPVTEYVFPEDIHNRRKMERLFPLVRHYCFQGHTHIPGIITENFEHVAPDQINDRCNLGQAKMMVNVGSVGQPRDGDNRACYLILDDGPNEDVGNGAHEAGVPMSSARIAYRRLPFDFETTIRKINDMGSP
jgi:predicted phosphodiesterase